MKIYDQINFILGSENNSISIEKPIDPAVPNEIIYNGPLFELIHGLVEDGTAILNKEFMWFSINSIKSPLRADITFYVSD